MRTPAPGTPTPTGIGVDVAREEIRIALSADRVKEIVRAVCTRERVRNAMISVTFVSDRAMARMNNKFLGHRGPTDIITFELNPVDGVIMGDMYIAPGVARQNAQEHGVGIREELVRLIVHGTLHVLGYTHPEDEHRTTSPMWKKQEKLVASIA